mmetsp:Transcript_44256/g.122523  ORF Transcript_44256/g.122523 Transcript_44256/m.122523 type:complete len:764 (+) Transcript_44256:86-2377(+)
MALHSIHHFIVWSMALAKRGFQLAPENMPHMPLPQAKTEADRLLVCAVEGTWTNCTPPPGASMHMAFNKDNVLFFELKLQNTVWENKLKARSGSKIYQITGNLDGAMKTYILKNEKTNSLKILPQGLWKAYSGRVEGPSDYPSKLQKFVSMFEFDGNDELKYFNVKRKRQQTWTLAEHTATALLSPENAKDVIEFDLKQSDRGPGRSTRNVEFPDTLKRGNIADFLRFMKTGTCKSKDASKLAGLFLSVDRDIKLFSEPFKLIDWSYLVHLAPWSESFNGTDVLYVECAGEKKYGLTLGIIDFCEVGGTWKRFLEGLIGNYWDRKKNLYGERKWHNYHANMRAFLVLVLNTLSEDWAEQVPDQRTIGECEEKNKRLEKTLAATEIHDVVLEGLAKDLKERCLNKFKWSDKLNTSISEEWKIYLSRLNYEALVGIFKPSGNMVVDDKGSFTICSERTPELICYQPSSQGSPRTILEFTELPSEGKTATDLIKPVGVSFIQPVWAVCAGHIYRFSIYPETAAMKPGIDRFMGNSYQDRFVLTNNPISSTEEEKWKAIGKVMGPCCTFDVDDELLTRHGAASKDPALMWMKTSVYFAKPAEQEKHFFGILGEDIKILTKNKRLAFLELHKYDMNHSNRLRERGVLGFTGTQRWVHGWPDLPQSTATSTENIPIEFWTKYGSSKEDLEKALKAYSQFNLAMRTEEFFFVPIMRVSNYLENDVTEYWERFGGMIGSGATTLKLSNEWPKKQSDVSDIQLLNLRYFYEN